MADGTQPVVTPPEAPVQQTAPAGAPQSAPASFAAPEAPALSAEDTEIARIMGDGDPGNFMDEFLQTQGVVLDEGLPQAVPPVQPQGQPPGQPIPAPLAPPANGAPAPATGPVPAVAPPAGQVDQNLLARVLGPPAAAVPPAQPGWPAAPPAQPAALPAPTGQPAAEPVWQPFNEAVRLPPEMAEALNHDDPNIRLQAVSASMAAVGNATAVRVIEHMKNVVLPAAMRATVGHVQQQTMQERVNSDLYGSFPNLRYASPQLMKQAADVVVQDELSRNPNATYSPEVVRKIGMLADAAMKQIASGQPVALTPAPIAYAPQPVAPAPATAPVQGQDGNWYVRTPQGSWAFYAPGQPAAPVQPVAPAGVPWMAGSSAQPFGFQAQPSPTPESEFAAFMGGADWGQ